MTRLVRRLYLLSDGSGGRRNLDFGNIVKNWVLVQLLPLNKIFFFILCQIFGIFYDCPKCVEWSEQKVL